MKLLVVTQTVDSDDPTLGFFHRWLEEFAREFESISVICLQSGQYSLPSNVQVYSLGKEEGKGRFTYLWRFYRYIVSLRSEYDAVFIHMNPEYVVLGGIVWRLLGKKVSLWYTHKSVDAKLKLATALAHVIFTASNESFRIESNKTRVVGHGIDVRVFESIVKNREHPFTLVTVGRVTKSKQLEILLEALAYAEKSEAKKWQLMLVGSPVTHEDTLYLEELHSLAKELGVAERVNFLGGVKQTELRAIFAGADVFVNLSTTGSLDKAPLEAFMANLPVITSNEAFVDMLQHIDAALFLSPVTPESLVQKLNYVAQLSTEEKEKMYTAACSLIFEDHALNELPKKIRQQLLQLT